MRKFTLTLFCIIFVSLFGAKAQQVNNPGFEVWDSLGTNYEEPHEWNSFKSASGLLYYFGQQQVKHSTLIRPGATGSYSCLIWSLSIGPVIANGLVTDGRINMGSTNAFDTSNYNATRTALPAFSEALGYSPDSLVVWVRFKPANSGGTDSARIHATVHDTYDLRDPINSASAPYVVSQATLNFASTNNTWVRKSIPFIHTGPASSPNYILISMTTNKTPGAGSGGDSLYVDDLSLIYNPGNNVPDFNYSGSFKAYADANDIIINMGFEKPTASDLAIYNINGQMVFKKHLPSSTAHEKVNSSSFVKGIYLVSVLTEDGQRFSQKIAVN